MSEKITEPNEIIRFLSGKWRARDVVITADNDVHSREYTEIMEIKDPVTVTITAIGYEDGRDISRDMIIEMEDEVTLRQANFIAKGSKDGNCVSLSGSQESRTYRFRLYLLGDKFIFQRDVVEEGNLIEAQMSYLIRISDP